MTPDQSRLGGWLYDNPLYQKILFTRPLMWYMVGNLMSDLKEYTTPRRSIIKRMPGKETR